ncbi:nucleotidyltransferase domain-containing protein [Chitinophaga rhizophila]|uniref:Nucleotidyltransferase domain-containing protein n=1 Tax=Chitinophaga rhizophila TaxID=2866212 RepID=A0ABS7GH19_9BACT|nr:nucleotidyltransferase domain-containing protein [Chitinophaga rhizophila]MBW8685937.1 nucleotidyltransferase domain-containing protein [Chitinophaga rhizophila]
MNDVIEARLQTLEQDKNVNILYACESGSRAWGFASPDSDYDVRFIYAQPVSEYLSINDRKDVIELPVNEVLDISGWDIRKVLQLYLKSNPPLYEWLQSSIVYKEQSGLRAELLQFSSKYFSGRAGCHHYISMAWNTFEHELQGEQVRIKKYFYALRPALAAQWIIQRKTMPPITFDELRTIITDHTWHTIVDELLEQKKVSDEKTLIAPLPVLQQWIAETIALCKEQAAYIAPLQNNADELNQLFRKYIAL